MNTEENAFMYKGISSLPENPAVTMAYIPFQLDTTEYSPDTALNNGTLFVDLNKPFLGGAYIGKR